MNSSRNKGQCVPDFDPFVPDRFNYFLAIEEGRKGRADEELLRFEILVFDYFQHFSLISRGQESLLFAQEDGEGY